MTLFSRDPDSEKLNVHEMATLWYEHHCGESYWRQGDYRNCLKQWSYLKKHFDYMLDDCWDFHYCAMRTTVINHFLQLWDYQHNIHQGKYAIKACLNLLKLARRIERDVKDDKAKVDALKAEHEEYLETSEHKDWQKEFD